MNSTKELQDLPLKRVILISGAQGSGKTTLADAITKRFFGRPKAMVCNLTFAEPLYRMHNFCRNTLVEAGIPLIHPVKDGPLLQLLGTEWGRNTYGADVWVDITKGQILKLLRLYDYVDTMDFIISDCRFKNEFNAFPDALRIRLECSRDIRKDRVSMWRDNESHPSEVDLDEYAQGGFFDLHFNTGIHSVVDCVAKIEETLEENHWKELRKS